MLTALKNKLGSSSGGGGSLGSNNRVGNSAIRTSGVVPINTELQKKFAHGVNFNMKIVIKGDRTSGKTCLFRRLQGQPFCENYVPTEEIQVANILWNYRASNHIVKMDVWDVVDASSRRTTRKINGLKLENNSEANTSVDPDLMICDATFVDVYKNCNGVLLIFDVTKSWTWAYVCKELDNIPNTIPVLVLANKVDLDKQREVHDEEVLTFLSSYSRKDSPNNRLKAPIRFTTVSNKTAHGLKYIYNFLNIPFLFLQREYLENSLDANKQEIDVAQCELDCYENNSDSPSFSGDSRRKTVSKSDETDEKDVQQPNGSVEKKRLSNSSDSEAENPVNMYEEDFDSNDECYKTLDEYVVKSASTPVPPLEQQTFTSFKEILKSTTNVTDESSVGGNTGLDTPRTEVELDKNVETPEEHLDSWLDDLESKTPEKKSLHVSRLSSSSSEDEQNSNPLVTNFEDTADSGSESQAQSHRSTSCSTTGVVDIRSTKPIKSDSKHPTSLKTSSTFENFLPSRGTTTSKDDARTKVRKKTKKSNDRSTRNKTSNNNNNTSNLLVEDPADMGDEQYDPI